MRTVLGETAPTLDDLVQNPSLEEVWINGPDQVFVAERGVSRAVPMSLSSVWSPPMVSEFFPDSLRIRVEARAQTFLR